MTQQEIAIEIGVSITHLKGLMLKMDGERASSLAITKLDECILWLEMTKPFLKNGIKLTEK